MIEAILVLLGVYAAIGVVFALAFVSVGVQRLDPAARGAGIGFRLLILPGVAAFWPAMAGRWLRERGSDDARRANDPATRETQPQQTVHAVWWLLAVPMLAILIVLGVARRPAEPVMEAGSVPTVDAVAERAGPVGAPGTGGSTAPTGSATPAAPTGTPGPTGGRP